MAKTSPPATRTRRRRLRAGEMSGRDMISRNRRGLVRRRAISRSWFGRIRRWWAVEGRRVMERMVSLPFDFDVWEKMVGRG